jgi:C_GCAxxG_C_C family probable redox protein
MKRVQMFLAGAFIAVGSLYAQSSDAEWQAGVAKLKETIGEENPQLVKAMGGLGGGIGYCGDTCGCLTGSACAIGYFLGNLAPEEKEDAQMKPAVQELYQWFHKKTEEEFGAFYCKDITYNLI